MQRMEDARRAFGDVFRGLRRPRSEHVALLVALAAIALRLYRRAPTWPSSDAADLPEIVSQYVCKRTFDLSDLRDLGLYRLGGVQPIVVYLEMTFLRLIGWHTTELTWESSTILVSAASTFTAFLFAREVAGAAAGIGAAILIAVCPLGIMLGRHLGAPWAYEECLQYLISYLIIATVRRQSRQHFAALSGSLAIYFWTGNQMPGIFPVVGYAIVVGLSDRASRARIVALLRSRAALWLVVPAASMGVLLYCTFVLRDGHLAHALFGKRHTPGLYFRRWFEDASLAIGPTATLFSLLLVVAGVILEKRVLSMRHVPVVLFVAYSAPFCLFIPPGSTLTRGYVLYGVSALLLAANTAAFSERLRAVRAPWLVAVISLMLVGEAARGTFRLIDSPLFAVRPFQGAYARNNGGKAAAAWIRSRGRPRGHVLSDASGGAGLEPSVVDMYFVRPTLGLFDAPNAATVFAHFSRYWHRIEYILVSPGNRELVVRYFPTFSPTLDITDGDRGVILTVYTGTPQKRERIDVSEADAEFQSRHSMLCAR